MDVKFQGPIKFKEIPNSDLPNSPGIYVIKISDYSTHAPLNREKIYNWIDTVKTFELKGFSTKEKSFLDKVMIFLDRFWIPERRIVYIGRAIGSNTIKKRLRAFSKHKLGKKRPHRGGHWLFTLSNYSDFEVYWYPCQNPKEIELICLKRFANSNLKGIIPFANLENWNKKRKQKMLRKTTIS